MASPALQPMCCWFIENASNETQMNHSDTDPGDGIISDWFTLVVSYNSLCIMASCLSILGAVYQLLPRRPSTMPRTEREMESFLMQNRIVSWLTLVDFLASLGILVRSSVWLAGYLPWISKLNGQAEMNFEHVFCAFTSAWIQFFYLCTYLWTLSYAIHMYRAAHSLKSSLPHYHILSWTVPSLLSAIGITCVYAPSPTSCAHSRWGLVPAYLSSYIPILVVMVANPVLYHQVSKTVQQTLRGRGLYTDQERMAVASLRSRFYSIMMVFYICWSPNIINSIIILCGNGVDMGVSVALWHFMAVVNPLQAFLNSFVYHSVGGCNIQWTQTSLTQQMIYSWRYKKRRPDIQHTSQTDFEESVETSPLLAFRNYRK